MPLERASQEEQTGANFSFIAPSSEELWVRKPQLFVCGKGRHSYMYMYASGSEICINLGLHNSVSFGVLNIFTPRSDLSNVYTADNSIS